MLKPEQLDTLNSIRNEYIFTGLDGGGDKMTVRKICKKFKFDYEIARKYRNRERWKEQREANIAMFQDAVQEHTTAIINRHALDVVAIRKKAVDRNLTFIEQAIPPLYKRLIDMIENEEQAWLIKDVLAAIRELRALESDTQDIIKDAVSYAEKAHQMNAALNKHHHAPSPPPSEIDDDDSDAEPQIINTDNSIDMQHAIMRAMNGTNVLKKGPNKSGDALEQEGALFSELNDKAGKSRERNAKRRAEAKDL